MPEIIQEVKKESLQAAEKVRDDIFEILDDLPTNPLKFQADKFKTVNDGNSRVFEKHSIRIASLFPNHRSWYWGLGMSDKNPGIIKYLQLIRAIVG